MSRGFVFAFPSEMIIDSVAVVGSKALSVKAPWLCLYRAHHRYSGKRGCGIIHDRRGHPSNARSNRNKAEHLGVTGPRAVLISPPGTDWKAAAQLNLFASSECLFQRWSLLFTKKKKKTTLCFCLWNKRDVLLESSWAREWTFLAQDELFFSQCEGVIFLALLL